MLDWAQGRARLAARDSGIVRGRHRLWDAVAAQLALLIFEFRPGAGDFGTSTGGGLRVSAVKH